MNNILVFVFIFSAFSSYAQNLVPNYSFENFTTCPVYQGQLYLAFPWDVVVNTGTATPDLYNSCNAASWSVPGNLSGYQYARTGLGYSGFYTYGANNCREYIQTQLISSLNSGVTYHVEAYVSPAEQAGIAVDGIGIYFSNGFVSGNGTYTTLPFTPQITNPTHNIISNNQGWTLVSGLYTASGGEDHITIGNFLDDVNTNTLVINPAGSGRGYFFIDDVSITEINPNPPVAIFNTLNHICPGTCLDFVNLSLNSLTYQWSFPGAMPDTSTANNPVNICYATSGSYDVQLIASNYNGSDTLLLTNYITVYPSPLPQAISQSGDTLFANAGAASYQWYFNGNLIPGATDYFYVATSSGDYNVVVTDENGCEVEAVIFNVVAGLQSTVDSQQLMVFPNPVKDKLTMHSRWLSGARCTIGTAVDVSIYNLVGEKVLMAANCLPIAIGMRTVDCRLLPPGIYWLEVSGGEKKFRAKFVKE